MGLGNFTCVCCGISYRREVRGGPKFCEPCLLVHIADRGAAHALVFHALKRGQLAPVRSLQCGCGKPAKYYEHRDYLKPLDVQPSCGSCNRLRGPAFNRTYRPQPAQASEGC